MVTRNYTLKNLTFNSEQFLTYRVSGASEGFLETNIEILKYGNKKMYVTKE